MTSVSEEMNLLALLSPTPAPVRLLMQDMDIDKSANFWFLVGSLSAHGHRIRSGVIPNSNETGVWIDKSGWQRAYRAAMEYAEKE